MAKTKSAGAHKAKKGLLGFFMNLILWIFSLSCIFPIVWMLYSSLKEKRAFNADIVGLPKSPTLINYTRILTNPDYHLPESMFNSFRTTALSILLIVAFSFIVGYILARVRFKLNRVLYVMFLMGMLIPIHSLLVPIYVVFKKCRPILVTVAIIQVFSCWNEFSFALVLIKDVGLQTVPLALTQFKGQFASDYPKQMAAMLLTMAPIVVLYFAFSRQIIKGMVAGAVKG